MTPYRPDAEPGAPDLGAFLPGPRLRRAGTPAGPLAGLTFAAKDLFDVAGETTGCGNPDWAASHATAARSAEAVRRLLDAGAELVGKTVTDEISLGLLGRNRHFGTPVNPRAPDRYPGGSSSGSAAAVAGGLCDLALGSDSGGSMRVPASFCGIYGLRPTHGAVPVEGLMVQSPSFDTAGFFAASAEGMARAGDVLLPPGTPGEVEEILIAEDAFAAADGEVREALAGALQQIGTLAPTRGVTAAPEGLRVWNGHHVHLQHPEFAATFGPWVDAVDPRLSFDVASAIANGSRLPEPARQAAKAFRPLAGERIETLLGQRRLLCLPTVPLLPPRRDMTLEKSGLAGERIVDLTCLAGLSGLPQISLPLGAWRSLPVGLSLIGWRGADRTLIETAHRLARLAAA